jgi:hypothetical protein
MARNGRRGGEETTRLLDNDGYRLKSQKETITVLGVLLGLAVCGIIGLALGLGLTRTTIVRQAPTQCKPFDVSECSAPEHISSMCDEAPLLRDVVNKATTVPLKVTRNSMNVAEFSGGSFAQMNFATGYEFARDRLFQFYFNYLALSGQLASVVGSSVINTDRAIIAVSYTDAEYLSDFNSQTQTFQLVITQTLAAVNQRIADVLTVGPVPFQFTKYGFLPQAIPLVRYLRFLHHLGRQFSAQPSVPGTMIQLTNFMNNQVTAGKSIADARALMNDLYNETFVSDSTLGITKSVDNTPIGCPALSAKKRKQQQQQQVPSFAGKRRVRDAPAPEESMSLEDYVAMMKNVSDTEVAYNIFRGGSFAMAFNKNYTESGKPILIAGSQAGQNAFPGFFWPANFKNEELGIDFNAQIVLGLNFAFGKFGIGGYELSSGAQVGTLPGITALLQDSTEDIFVRNETIVVRGGPNVTQSVYVSAHSGFVSQRGLTSTNLWTGQKSLVHRDLSYGDIFSGLSQAVHMSLSKSACQVRNTVMIPSSTSFGQYRNSIDNQCNTIGILYGGWYDFGQDFVPQGILGQAITAPSDTPLKAGYFIANNPSNVILSWNTPDVEDMRSTQPSELSRRKWMEHILANKTSGGQLLTVQSSQELLTMMSQAISETRFLLASDRQNYNQPIIIHMKDRLLRAIAVYPNPTRLQAAALLQNYNGFPVQGTYYDMINSRTYADETMLSIRWITNVMNSVSTAVFGLGYASGDLAAIVHNTYTYDFYMRVLNVTNINKLNYPGYTTAIPDQDLLIVNALDAAITTLGGFGARPWGVNARPLVTYRDSLNSVVVMDQSPFPVSNRAAMYQICYLNNEYKLVYADINQIGVAEHTAAIANSTSILALDTAMQSAHHAYQPLIR